MASDEAPHRRTLSARLHHRARKDADRSSSPSSLTSQADDLAHPHTHGLKPTLDGAFGKLKERARRSIDERRPSVGDDSRRSRLLPTSKSKRSRKKGAADAAATGDVSRDSSVLGVSPTPSELSLGLHGSGHSSLLTEDDDDDDGCQSKPLRPTLSPHQSHAGYLTISSPLINASTSDPSLPDPDDLAGEALAYSSIDTPDSLQPANPPRDRRQSPVDRSRGTSAQPKEKPPPPPPDQLPTLVVDSPSREELPRADLDARAPRPSTPQSGQPPAITTVPSTPPNARDTPITLVTPPTPITSPSTFAGAFGSSTAASPASANSASQRRKRAGTFTSSKLSASISASPLTPHIEETKTPGGTLTAPSGSSGFFSSVFSAAQNAANQLSNSLNPSTASNNQKHRSPQPDQPRAAAGQEEVTPGTGLQPSSSETDSGAKRQLAVETLGKGDLSLDQLGFTESEKVSPMTSNLDLADNPSNSSQSDGNTQTQKQEETAAQRAITAAYEKPLERAMAQALGGRPRSVASADGSDAGPGTPTRPSSVDGHRRAGSVRSRLSGHRRHRGSSAATGGTLAAAISASTAALANPVGGVPGHRATGFAVASSKRNKDFHQLFRSVPEDDYLIEDYSAALQRDILLHGRLYVSEAHICFSSNILGWVTNLIISFDEVVSVEKKNTAVIFPNAIVIQTLHARNVFASLVARDSTYELIVGIWKISHPNLKSSLHGVALDDAGTGDKTERAESVMSGEASDQGSDDDEVYDEDEDGDIASFYEPGGSVAGSEAGGDYTVSRKTSGAPVASGAAGANGATKGSLTTEAAPPGASATQDFPGPATHPATDCDDQDTHYDRPLTDVTIQAPLGKVYSLMWGPQASVFMKKWLVEDQKSRELAYEDDKIGLDETHRTVTYSYIKPLNAPVGPKQTKCITTCTLDQIDLEKAVSVSCSTVTPDVPSGNIFTTKTKYCLMWGPGNSTRLVASCTIEWTGKSWLRGPIEKGANDGQIQYVKDIVIALRAACVARVAARGAGPRGKGKGRRKQDPSDIAAEGERIAVATVKAEEKANWGIFEPIRSILEPITSILEPLISTRVVMTILVVFLAYSWLWPSRKPVVGLGFPIDSPGRLAAYEEIWRREESELWDWLEDRVGLSNGIPVMDAGDRQKALGVKSMGRKVRDVKMEQRQVDDAIRVTEERLTSLKEAVKKRKGE